MKNCLLIFLLGIFLVIFIKPKKFYKEDGKTFKCWKEIDINDVDTLYNIYVYFILLGFFSYYLANEI